LACVSFLQACSAVYSNAPVGDTPVPVSEQEWAGTWLGPGGAVTVAVSDADKGVLQAAWIEHRQDRLDLESHRVWLAQSGEWLFASVEDKERPGHYVWAHIVRDGEQLILWVPDPARVKALVEQGKLRGRALEKDGDDVLLEPLNDQDLDLLMSPAGGAVDWRRATAFIRVAK
jgi:hypothetical protein